MMNRHLRRAIIASVASAGIIVPVEAKMWTPPKPSIIKPEADWQKLLPVVPGVMTLGMLPGKAVAAANISFISAQNGTNTTTLGAHVTGDIIFVFSMAQGSTSAPTGAAGYTIITSSNAGGGDAYGMKLGYKIAASSSETTGTWTGGTHTITVIYRGVSAIGANSTTNSAVGGTYSFNAVTLQVGTGTSWVVSFSGRNNNFAFTTVPAGLTSRINTGGTRALDTNAGVSSFASKTGGAEVSERWVTTSVELKA